MVLVHFQGLMQNYFIYFILNYKIQQFCTKPSIFLEYLPLFNKLHDHFWHENGIHAKYNLKVMNLCEIVKLNVNLNYLTLKVAAKMYTFASKLFLKL